MPQPSRFHLLLAAQLLVSAAQAMEGPPAEAERLPEEIIVTEQKEFWLLEQQIFDAEEAVYNIYNDLNDDDLYDFHCSWEEPTGTHIKHLVCRPQFLIEATRENGRDTAAWIMGYGARGPVVIMTRISYHNPILKSKMHELVNSSPTMQDAVIHHQHLLKEREQRRAAR